MLEALGSDQLANVTGGREYARFATDEDNGKGSLVDFFARRAAGQSGPGPESPAPSAQR